MELRVLCRPVTRGPKTTGLAVVLLSLVLAACGGSGHSGTSAAKASKTPRPIRGGSSIHTGPVHAKLVGQSHQPVAKKNWIYTVTASDAHGHPLSGTTLTEFAFQGIVEGKEAPPVHRLRHGRLRDTIDFPAMAVGYPIELQVVVRTRLGSVTLDWPVTVRK